MGALLGFIVSVVSVILQTIATLDVTPYCILWMHQPKAPKSLLR